MVVKMRGSERDKNVRQLVIDGTGMHLGAAFTDSAGIFGKAAIYEREWK